MLGSMKLDVRQKDMDIWDSAVDSLGIDYIPVSTMQQLPEGNNFSTAPSASLQTDIVQYSLGLAKPINDAAAKGVKPSVYRCNPEYGWESSNDL